MYFHRPLVFLFVLTILLSGCQKNEEQSNVSADGTAGQAMTRPGLETPDKQILDSLGPENGIDFRWHLSDPIYVMLGHPKRFFDSPIGKGNEPFVSNMMQMFLQIPFNPVSVRQFVQVCAVPVEVTVQVEQNGVHVPQQVPISRRSTVLIFDKPVNKDDIFKPIFGDPAEAESMKKAIGEMEYYDLTPPNLAVPQRAAIHFIDENTIVLVEGEEKDIQDAFDAKPPQSAAIDRMKRIDADACDLALVASLEGGKIDYRFIEVVLVQNGVFPEFASAIAKNFRAAMITINTAAEAEKPVLKIVYDARTPEGAAEIAETAQGLLIMGQTTLAAMDDSIKASLPIPTDFAVSALGAFSVNLEGPRVQVEMEQFEGFQKAAADGIRGQQTMAQNVQLQQQRNEQLVMTARIFFAYYQQHQKFPSDIKAEDGRSLLSWRVAVLPIIGLEELYKKFKLDEPWDSETNKPLMDTMPTIFRPFHPEVAPPKTLIRFFDSEGTPLSNPDLKPEDLKFPQSTLLFVSVRPEKAIEWTRPETLNFELNKLEETVGDSLFGLSFAGQIVAMPIIPLDDPRSEQQRKFLESLIKGLPLPVISTETPANGPPTNEPGPVVPAHSDTSKPEA